MKHIPELPVMPEQGLEAVCAQENNFGEIYLDCV